MSIYHVTTVSRWMCILLCVIDTFLMFELIRILRVFMCFYTNVLLELQRNKHDDVTCMHFYDTKYIFYWKRQDQADQHEKMNYILLIVMRWDEAHPMTNNASRFAANLRVGRSKFWTFFLLLTMAHLSKIIWIDNGPYWIFIITNMSSDGSDGSITL